MKGIFTIGGGALMGWAGGCAIMGDPFNWRAFISGAVMSLIGFALHWLERD